MPSFTHPLAYSQPVSVQHTPDCSGGRQLARERALPRRIASQGARARSAACQYATHRRHLESSATAATRSDSTPRSRDDDIQRCHSITDGRTHVAWCRFIESIRFIPFIRCSSSSISSMRSLTRRASSPPTWLLGVVILCAAVAMSVVAENDEHDEALAEFSSWVVSALEIEMPSISVQLLDSATQLRGLVAHAPIEVSSRRQPCGCIQCMALTLTHVTCR